MFTYWDKIEKKNIGVPLPIKFVTIAELNTITGFNDENQCGVYSNEVHNLNEPLSVRLFCKGNHGANGTYEKIKGEIKSLGGRFTKSIYALMINGKEVELVNFKASGSFLNAWIDKNVNADVMGIIINDLLPKKKGSNDYLQPVIEGFEIKDTVKTREIAQGFYKKLNDYFADKKTYFESEIAAREIEDGYEKEPVIIDGNNKESIYKNIDPLDRINNPYPAVEDSSDLPF